MNRYRSIALLLGATLVASCEKNVLPDITGPLPTARIKFFNFGVNAPGVNFYAGTTKMTAINSTTGAELTTGVTYGLTGNGGFYSAIAPGTYTPVTGKIAATVDKDLAISPLTVTIADGESWSYYISGFYDATNKVVESFAVKDPLPTPIDYTQAYVRFVNAISNSSAQTLYAKNTTTLVEVPVGAAVTYKSAGAFTALPAAVYDLYTRNTGSATNVITRTAVSFVAGRVYTISSRGDITVVSATATNRPQLDNTANR